MRTGWPLSAFVPVHADMGGQFQIADEDMADGARRIGYAQGLDVGHTLSNCGRRDGDDRPSPMKPPNELAAAKWTGENGYARMMIRDLETHIRIGVHAHERIPDKPQRIIVNVEMFADGKSHLQGEGLASVINYDPIHDAILAWEGRPHVLLIETLLEELIALCFRDERVRACKVSIVKPDIYDAAAAPASKSSGCATDGGRASEPQRLCAGHRRRRSPGRDHRASPGGRWLGGCHSCARGKLRHKSLAEEMGAQGHKVAIVSGDLSEPDVAEKIFGQVRAKLGRCTFLVNSAAAFAYDDIGTVSAREHGRALSRQSARAGAARARVREAARRTRA